MTWRIENRVKLSYAELILYLGDADVAYRCRKSLHRKNCRVSISVADVDAWLMRRVPCEQWPSGLVSEGLTFVPKPSSPRRRDYGMRLPEVRPT
jgi:hypothetical protein